MRFDCARVSALHIPQGDVMDKTERDLRRYMRKKEREKNRPRRIFWTVVIIAIVLIVILAILSRTHIVIWWNV